MKAEFGTGTARANEVKFLWNLLQSSIDRSILDSESSALPMDHGAKPALSLYTRNTYTKPMYYSTASAPLSLFPTKYT